VALTDSLVVVSEYLFDLITQNKTPLGLQDIYYGDQALIPRTPALCVESDTKTREIDGAPRRTLVQLNTFLILYHSPVKDIQKTRKDVDILAEAVETLVHADAQMNHLVIHSLVTTMQSGYAMKTGTQIRSCRLTVQATSQVLLPLARQS
jgi:hypothetical protein